MTYFCRGIGMRGIKYLNSIVIFSVIVFTAVMSSTTAQAQQAATAVRSGASLAVQIVAVAAGQSDQVIMICEDNDTLGVEDFCSCLARYIMNCSEMNPAPLYCQFLRFEYFESC